MRRHTTPSCQRRRAHVEANVAHVSHEPTSVSSHTLRYPTIWKATGPEWHSLARQWRHGARAWASVGGMSSNVANVEAAIPRPKAKCFRRVLPAARQTLCAVARPLRLRSLLSVRSRRSPHALPESRPALFCTFSLLRVVLLSSVSRCISRRRGRPSAPGPCSSAVRSLALGSARTALFSLPGE